jgi:cellobiose-specific phosphotransferase system component IIA
MTDVPTLKVDRDAVYEAARAVAREQSFTAAIRALDEARERLAKTHRVQASREGWVT